MPGPRTDFQAAAYLQTDAYPHWIHDTEHTPACRNTPLALWFPDRQGAAITVARAVCGTCPLLDTCRTWALEQTPRYLHGVWGGTTQHEREALYRQRKAQAQEAA